jgi:hypothetical protein
MIEHLSYSAISLYLSCPENFRRKYIAKEPTITTPALVFGSAFHDTVEQYLVGTRDLDSGTITDIWQRTWAAQLEREPNCDWGADTPEQYHNDGIRLLSAPDVIRMIDGIRLRSDDNGPMVERKLTLTVPGVPVPIIGYMDIMTADGIPGDFKTSAYSWSQDKARGELQPAFYLAALNQMGHSVPGLRFRHYVVTKGKQPKAQVLEHQRTWDEILWLYELIQGVWNAIEKEVYPLNPSSWLCSPKYCSFWSGCRGRGL